MAASVKFDKVAQPELAEHDSSILDLAFAMDCTGSMSSYIHSAQKNIRTIAEKIVAEEKSDIRLALVEYRDHPPQDTSFVTRVNDFTSSVKTMRGWLDQANAAGGGDCPEAVADAMHAVLKLSWREEATKICVFISDAPPHGLGCRGDSMPNGCPDGLDPVVLSNQLAEKGITMYMVGCEPAINTYRDFFMAVAHITGGQYVPLGNAELLAQVIIGGAQEEISLQRLMADVSQEVEQDRAGGAVWDEEEVSRRVHSRMQSQGVKSKKLLLNKSSLPPASSFALSQAACLNMADVSKAYKERAPVAPLETIYMFNRGHDGLNCAPADPSWPPPPGGALADPSWPPRGASARVESRADDIYSVATSDIDYAQANRLVQKAYKKKSSKN